MPSSAPLFQLELFNRARPVVFQQPRQRTVRENLAARLTSRAIVGLVLGVADALHCGSAYRAGLAEPAMHRHAFAKRGDTFGEGSARLGAQVLRPFPEHRA